MKQSCAPLNWTERRLKFAAIVNPVKSEVAHLPLDTQVSFVPMDNIGEYGGIRLDIEKSIEEVYTGYTYFKDGDVVIAKITPCFENGKCAIATGLKNGVGFGTTELHVVRADRKYSIPEFLFYYAVSHKFNKMGEAEMYGAGGQKRVPDAYVRNERLSLPPIDEQRAIAAFLDRKTAQIDSLIEKKRRMIELLKEKRTALISHAVTKGLNPDAPMKDSGVPWLGQVPAHWEVKRLRFVCKMAGGVTPNTMEPGYWDGMIPWVSPKDMKSAIIEDSIDHVTELALAETGLKMLGKATLLVVVRGMILIHSFPVAITSVPVTINQDMKALTNLDGINVQYLQSILNSAADYIVNMLVETAGHGTKKLNTDLFASLKIVRPPMEEQMNINDYLEAETKKIDNLTDKIDRALDRLQEYRVATIAAAVTGQIDVRNHGAA